MSGSILTTYEKDGFGLIEVADGRTVSTLSDLVAAMLRFWSSKSVHTLILTDPGKRVTVTSDLVAARAVTAPGGIPEALLPSFPPLSRGQVFDNILHVLRHGCRIDEVPGVTDQGVNPLPIRRVGVVGAGTMGAAIAFAYASAGCDVLLKDVDQGALDRADAVIRGIAESPVGPNKLPAEEAVAIFGRVKPTLDFAGFDDLDLVVESVPESIDLKKVVFAELDTICHPRTILASNTSSLSLAHLATATQRPNKVVGQHFFHPVSLRPLLEIGRTAVTSIETLVSSIEAARLIGLTPLMVPDVNGFLANRVPFLGWLEALLMLEEGVDPQRIDRVCLDMGLSVGSIQATDMVGHDVAYLAFEVMRENVPRGGLAPFPRHVSKMVEAGRLGVKSGVGYYRYEAGDPTPIPDPDLAKILDEARSESGLEIRDDVTDAEIADRLMLPTINHGADALDDRIARSPAEIDVAMVIGYGSPAHLGGPMRSADRIGLDVVVDRLRTYHGKLGPRFEPSPHLVRLAEAGKTFYEP